MIRDVLPYKYECGENENEEKEKIKRTFEKSISSLFYKCFDLLLLYLASFLVALFSFLYTFLFS
jgi:hypothetical protein